VPVRDAEATVAGTLSALAAQELDRPYEVIVVDSGSKDATVELVRSAPVVSALLFNPGGEPAGSRNLGASRARGPVLAFTDGDCEPVPQWLSAGLQAISNADLVQGKVVPAGPAGPFDRTLSVAGEYGLYETANLFVRREVFDRLGGFERVVALETGELAAGAPGLGSGSDTRPFGEDAWFAWRAKRDGARTTFSEQSLVRHAVVQRGPLEFITECARRRYFPPLVALIPELRDQFLHRRWFLSPSSMRFDLALAGVALALASSRRAPALAAAPYLATLMRQTRRWPLGQRAQVLATIAAADAVTFAGLLRGSIHARAPVL
jgi:cellulose synthase/poly-beta-1,6-N-acetylglucosamine synthase-like glycosyltransferase